MFNSFEKMRSTNYIHIYSHQILLDPHISKENIYDKRRKGMLIVLQYITLQYITLHSLLIFRLLTIEMVRLHLDFTSLQFHVQLIRNTSLNM